MGREGMATPRGYAHTRLIVTIDFELQCFEMRALHLPLSSHDSTTTVDSIYG